MPEKFEPQEQEITCPEAEKTSDLNFRDLKIEDCDDMVNVVNSVFEDGTHLYGKDKTSREKWLPVLKDILERIESGRAICVVAEKEGHVVGWMGGKLKTEETDVPTVDIFTAILSKEGRAGLKNFRGLVDAWFAKAMDRWPDTKKFETRTGARNRVLKLYKRFYGFKETDRITMPDGVVVANLERSVE